MQTSPTWRIQVSPLVCRPLGSIRSAPEQNAPPAPVITTTRSLGDCDTPRNVARSSSHITLLMAFLRSGRVNVTVTIPSARSIWRVSIGGTILVAVGFNPFRQQRRSPADYVMVAAAMVVIALLVAWALFG